MRTIWALPLFCTMILFSNLALGASSNSSHPVAATPAPAQHNVARPVASAPVQVRAPVTTAPTVRTIPAPSFSPGSGAIAGSTPQTLPGQIPPPTSGRLVFTPIKEPSSPASQNINPGTPNGLSTTNSQPASGSSGYTFSKNASGMVQTFQNGQLISTGTAQNAAQQYGYKEATQMPMPNMSVAAPTTPVSIVQQPTHIGVVPTSQSGTSASPQYMEKGAPVPPSVNTQGLTTLANGQKISTGVLAATQNTSALDTNSKVNLSKVYNDGYFYTPGTNPSLQKECVAVVGALRPDIGSNTNNWSQGSQVAQPKPGGGWIADSALVPGTPIATFKNGSYPGKTGTMDNSPSCTAANVSSCAHSAIFEGYTYDNKGNVTGMKILEQSDLFSARVGEKAFSAMHYPYSVIDNFSKFSSQ